MRCGAGCACASEDRIGGEFGSDDGGDGGKGNGVGDFRVQLRRFEDVVDAAAGRRAGGAALGGGAGFRGGACF